MNTINLHQNGKQVRKSVLNPLPETIYHQIIGTLIVFPGSYYEICDIIQPFMFPEKFRGLADEIWHLSGEGKKITPSLLIAENHNPVLVNNAVKQHNSDTLIRNCRKAADYYLSCERIALMQNAIADLTSGQDYHDVTSKLEMDVQNLADFVSMGEGFKAVVQRVIDLTDGIRAGTIQRTGISTGFKDLDRITGGWQPAQYVLICARTHVGKTWYMAFQIMAIAAAGIPAAFFSLEMSKEEIFLMFICIRTNLSREKLRNPESMAEIEYKHYREQSMLIAQWPIYLYDASDVRGESRIVRDEMIRLSRQKGVRVAAVDYIQKFGGDSKKPRTYQIEDISRDIDQGIKIGNLTGLVGCQINRLGAGKRPGLQHLKDSGSLEQDPDVIILCYRDEKAERRKDPESFDFSKGELPKFVMEQNIAKNRTTGKLGAVYRKLEKSQLREWYPDEGQSFPTEKDEPKKIQEESDGRVYGQLQLAPEKDDADWINDAPF